MLNKNTNVIPFGYYCYASTWSEQDGKYVGMIRCPYWERRGESNTYCAFLEKDDQQIRHDKSKMGDPRRTVSLMYDEVKECGKNIQHYLDPQFTAGETTESYWERVSKDEYNQQS